MPVSPAQAMLDKIVEMENEMQRKLEKLPVDMREKIEHARKIYVESAQFDPVCSYLGMMQALIDLTKVSAVAML